MLLLKSDQVQRDNFPDFAMNRAIKLSLICQWTNAKIPLLNYHKSNEKCHKFLFMYDY